MRSQPSRRRRPPGERRRIRAAVARARHRCGRFRRGARAPDRVRGRAGSRHRCHRRRNHRRCADPRRRRARALHAALRPLRRARSRIARDRRRDNARGLCRAALAYGTAAVPAVDKICGPGNAYVAAAKRRVFGTVGIDMVAGVSEILIIADATAHPDWVALDLFSQAEHDELAQAILLTPDAELIKRVKASAQRLIADMPRADIIAASFARRGALIRTRDLAEACALANRIAPEHLEL